MTETQRAAMQAAHDAIALAQNNLAASRESAIAFDDGDLWDQYQRAMDGITAALAEPEPAEVPFAYLPVNLPDVFTHNAGCTLWAGNPQNKTLSADNSMIAVYTRPQSREPLTDEQIKAIQKTIWHPAWCDESEMRFARAIEAAHGIGAKP